MSRRLAAPREDVWAAWTTPELLEQWYSPGPINWQVDILDVRPGGAFRMRMARPDGEQVAEGAFHQVEKPRLLVQGPSDDSMTITTRLARDGNGTHMVVEMTGLPADRYEMMTSAWNAGFDKLEALLAT